MVSRAARARIMVAALLVAGGLPVLPGSLSAQVGYGCPAGVDSTRAAVVGGLGASQTLSGILWTVLEGHPALKAFASRSEAVDARTRDRLQRPNPEVEADVGGSGPFDELVGGLELSLPLRRAGETGALVGSGAAERMSVAADCGVARAELLASAAAAYADLLAASDRLSLAEEELEVARGFQTRARRRAELALAGDLPVLQAEILVQEAAVRRDEAEGAARSARARLAALLGLPTGTAVAASESNGSALDHEWALLAALPDTVSAAPVVAAARARLELARKEIELARASRRVGPRVGLRAERDTGGEFKLFALAGIALPLFSKPGYAVGSAEATAAAASWELRADSLAMAGALAAALADYDVARGALERIEAETLPRAVRLEAAARTNVEQGAAGFALWLEARRSWLELRDRAVELRRRVARAALDVRRVTGDFDHLLEEAS